MRPYRKSPRPFVQRDVAERIVRRLVAMPNLSLDDLDALGEYTRTIARLQSTEGDDVLRALVRLEGHWDSAMRARTARTAARRPALAVPRVPPRGCRPPAG